MSDDLRALLEDLMSSPDTANPALTALIDDYAKYHVVLVVLGGIFVVALGVLGVFLWRRFARARRSDGASRFERWIYACLGLVSSLLGAFMALVVAANVSNALNRRDGFAGSLGLLGTPKPGTARAGLYEAFAGWLRSADAAAPTAVQAAIDDRLSWQRPKAIVCAVLLAVFVVLCAWIWRTLIRWSRTRRLTRLGDLAMLGAGVLTVFACVLLMVMVIGNVQGSIAPIALTLFYG